MSPNPIADRLESMAQAIAERVVHLVMDAIDLDAVLDGVDIDRIIQRVDIDALINRVDVDAIIDRVDVDKIIERVDVDKIIERVDVNSIVGRVDVDHIVGELDIDALMEQTELGSIIARSTTGVVSEVLDVIRAQGVGLDDFFARWTNRLLRRKESELQLGPPSLVGITSAAGPAPLSQGTVAS